jgi:imidazolonepropionase
VSGTRLLTGIGELVTADPTAGDGSPLGLLRDAALVVESGRVAWVGPAQAAPAVDEAVDLGGAAVVPGFVDSHNHLVFAGERGAEFAARMSGLPYTAGGIASTVAATRAAADATLAGTVRRLVAEMTRGGTTTFETKSGYGLTVVDEERSLAVARVATPETTFLGAHVVPPEYAGDRDAYVDLVRGPMLDACASHARWVDVFCDRGAFDEDETRAVVAAGVARGLLPRLHGNQLGPGPGVRVAVDVGAASVDHCTYLDDADVAALAGSDTVATLLPGAEFSTRAPYPDARRLVDAGVAVAVATDCNPGSSYTTSMAFCIAVAVREMRLTPAEALLAATVGGARALRRSDVGTLALGMRADLAVIDAPSYVHLAYRPGVPLVRETWREGVRVA